MTNKTEAEIELLTTVGILNKLSPKEVRHILDHIHDAILSAEKQIKSHFSKQLMESIEKKIAHIYDENEEQMYEAIEIKDLKQALKELCKQK